MKSPMPRIIFMLFILAILAGIILPAIHITITPTDEGYRIEIEVKTLPHNNTDQFNTKPTPSSNDNNKYITLRQQIHVRSNGPHCSLPVLATGGATTGGVAGVTTVTGTTDGVPASSNTHRFLLFLDNNVAA